MFLNKREIIFQEIRCFFLLLMNLRGFRNTKVLCFGGQYSFFLITKLFGRFLGPGYHLYIHNFYLHELGNKKIIKRILRFLLNTRYTTLIVQSPDELNYYKPLSRNVIPFVPYCEDPAYSMDFSNVPEGDYLFTGGYTNRDYALILECARLNPVIKFVLVVSRLNKEIAGEKLPDNIIIYEEVDVSTFNGLMNKSIGVIVPLKENVGASGQMLCIGAMKMAKPIIYCDISSINYYFNNSSCGIPYSMGKIGSLNEAVNKLISGKSDVKEMGDRAFRHFSANFTLDKRNENLLNLILEN
jgi:glycosyltransferase involved in cell wall biosynthesis